METSVSDSPLSGRLQRFADGEGIVYATRRWVHVRMPMWRQLDRETQQVLATRERPRDGEHQTTGGRERRPPQ